MGSYLRDVMSLNAEARNFRVVWPNETTSNRLDAVLEVTDRVWMERIEPYDVGLSRDGCVTEVLSEGWLEGYLLSRSVATTSSPSMARRRAARMTSARIEGAAYALRLRHGRPPDAGAALGSRKASRGTPRHGLSNVCRNSWHVLSTVGCGSIVRRFRQTTSSELSSARGVGD